VAFERFFAGTLAGFVAARDSIGFPSEAAIIASSNS